MIILCYSKFSNPTKKQTSNRPHKKINFLIIREMNTSLLFLKNPCMTRFNCSMTKLNFINLVLIIFPNFI
eukprot:UN16302